ncbi:hypothetical protein CN984_23590 [Bacillus cereus]|uniref:HNH domain-containing protein n=1 Tax=Bacillus cereus TaxID=1396 RepID=A0A2B9PLE2_BACCE|nr:HNH endonuclease signature motif containing protein [Bacillus cereus]PGO23364.1 hypothetical protein CN984_23590 [Bacillus cereus]
MEHKRKNVNGYDIMQYWKGKFDIDGIPYIEDIDVVQCFRCRKYSKKTCENIEDEMVLKNYWNKELSGFVKAYIIPHTTGGESHPSNLMFLCEHCNRDDLDIYSKELYMNWLNRERKKYIFGVDFEFADKMTQCLVKYGMTNDVNQVLTSEEERKKFFDFANENNAFKPSVSKKTQYETFVGLMIMYIDELNKHKISK